MGGVGDVGGVGGVGLFGVRALSDLRELCTTLAKRGPLRFWRRAAASA